ncbi:PREDICTED: cystatin-11 [Elephantulus edwardii]|uniref:cystatin-11 n=1 Tax=Elephantulus edwardii TaxID=28737 RepID=UPI0003F0982F|nr:PREDICTED: cystatin-11 [Elephantulus edwardii]
MASSWQAFWLLLAMLVVLVALTNQTTKKSFISIQEAYITEPYVENTIRFLIGKYNQESKDPYNFRIVRVLNIQRQVTDHLEYHFNIEMRRTKCKKTETINCEFQERELYKQIKCYFSVFAIPWFEKYKILSKNCTNA